MQTLCILVVEDNRDIAENLVSYLEQCGHEVDSIHSGQRAYQLLTHNQYDLLCLDVMLPGMDGFTLARKVRQTLNLSIPILFLTARDTLEDKVEGFGFGGDDYLTKPFDLQEVELRITALARRAYGNVTNKLLVGEWRVESTRMQIFYQDRPLKTTQTGFKVFKVLAQNYPDLVSRHDLERALWGELPPVSDALRSHMFALRKSIKEVVSGEWIETVHGLGFRLVVE
ncbi:response regulator transcription factor [Paraglaciecola sp.]|uniref:response regulator transcription factor n=1 Tax=Paraglaciecola sp. TaxID=1920173 RepID=UPI003EF4FD5C